MLALFITLTGFDMLEFDAPHTPHTHTPSTADRAENTAHNPQSGRGEGSHNEAKTHKHRFHYHRIRISWLSNTQKASTDDVSRIRVPYIV